MPALAAFLASTFGSLFAFLLKHFTQRVAVAATLGAAVLSVSLVFYIAIQALVSGVMRTVDNEFFLMGFYALWPENASLCISACIGAEVAAFIYRHKIRLIQMVSGVN
jgi:hypothetical protein